MLKNIFIFFIILLFPIFLIKEYRILKSKKNFQVCASTACSNEEKYPLQDKSFTLIVFTQNDAETIERNYASIVSQDYKDYHVIYIDQGSSDETVSLLKKKIGSNAHVKVIECVEMHDAYKMYYQEVLKCLDDDIIVHLYGSDWLAHDKVLCTLCQFYSHPKVWLSYAQYLEYGNNQETWPHPKPKTILSKKRAQKTPWILAPFKTYYAGLLKKICINKGFFLSIEDEKALLNPVAELSGSQVRFIPDVLFIHYKKKGRAQPVLDKQQK